MKLDRNTDGGSKYAAINMRRVHALNPEQTVAAQAAIAELEKLGVLVKSSVGSEDEFFLIKLKDRYAFPALAAYAQMASRFDTEYAEEIRQMSKRSGLNSPWCKPPD